MSHPLKIIVLLSLLGTSCAHTNSEKASSANESWTKVLETLNQLEGENSTLPFTHLLEEDLLALNETELATIEKKAPTRKPPKTQAERDLINTYFQKEVEKLNQPLFTALKKVKASSAKTLDHREAAKKALFKIDANPYARPESVHGFFEGSQIGFCFTRALLVHYWLLKEGVPQSDIAKVFTIGDLSVKGIFWRFHVAIWLRDPKEGFIVVDPLQKDILPYGEWLAINQGYDIKKPYSRTRFYMTSPRKFLPAFGAYNLTQLQNPIFKEYFEKVAPTL